MQTTEIVHCGRCGRELKTKESKENGFGRCCLKKVKAEAEKAEFEKNQTKMFEGETN